MPFAVIDRDRDGAAAVLLVVHDKAEAENIAMDLRHRGMRADVAAVQEGGDG